MSTVKGKSGLLLPEYTGKMTGNFVMSVDELSKWRDNLSLANLSQTAKELYVVLQDSHQASLSKKQRYEILEFIKPTLNYLSQAMQHYYETQEILSDSQLMAIDLIYSLYFEMLNGYKIVIEEIEKSLLPNRKLLFLALQNAFYYSGLILLFSYKEHLNPPSGIWQEIHRLFLFTNRKKIGDKSLPKSLEWEYHYNTLNDIYKHCLLFALCSPFRLRKDEILHLYYATQIWAPLLALTQSKLQTPSSFFVDLEKDFGPLNALYTEPSEERIDLNLDEINNRLQQLISVKKIVSTEENYKQRKFSHQELILPLDLLSELLKIWNPQEIAKKREKMQGNVSVCLGILSGFWYLEQARHTLTAPLKFAFDKNFAITEVIDIDTLPGQGKSSSKYPLYICELIDVSENGYCLKWLNEAPPFLQCGEIIGIPRKINHHHSWSIGAIRWIKTEENNTIFLGVEILSHFAISTKVRLYGSDRAPFPALLLKENTSLQKPMTLVTPLLFKADQEIEIHIDTEQYTALLLHNLSRSPNYAEFTLNRISPTFIFPDS